MTFAFTIPELSGTPLIFTLEIGQCIFVLGANGTGKSSLMHKFYSAHHATAQRISAHRQTWFSSSSVTLSPEQKETQKHKSQAGIQALIRVGKTTMLLSERT